VQFWDVQHILKHGLVPLPIGQESGEDATGASAKDGAVISENDMGRCGKWGERFKPFAA